MARAKKTNAAVMAQVLEKVLSEVPQVETDTETELPVGEMDLDALTDDEILAMLSEIDARKEVVSEEAEIAADDAAGDRAEVIEVVEDSNVVAGDLIEMVKALSEDERRSMAAATQKEFDERSGFEAVERPANLSMQDKLKGYARKMTTLGLAGIMLAANVHPDFINRSVTEGRRFNIYAIDKVNDLLVALNSGQMKNGVNVAIMKSLFRFRAAGLGFNGVAAIAACSDKVKVEKGMAAVLVRHTVSAATAPTQTSSTMNALQVLGVVKNRGSSKFPLWELTDTPVTRRLEEVLKAA